MRGKIHMIARDGILVSFCTRSVMEAETRDMTAVRRDVTIFLLNRTKAMKMSTVAAGAKPDIQSGVLSGSM
jgi:hypothetical protein